MTQILDKFGLYITHLENVDTDTNYRAKERNRIKGYLKMEKFKNVGEIMFLSGTSKTYHTTIASLPKRKNQ